MTDWGRGLRVLSNSGASFGFRVANYRDLFVNEIFHKTPGVTGTFNPGAAKEPVWSKGVFSLFTKGPVVFSSKFGVAAKQDRKQKTDRSKKGDS